MTIWEEGRLSVRGAIRVLRLDPDGVDDFNLTLDGYWRSFYAALFLLPLYIVYLQALPIPDGVSVGRYWLIEAIAYPLVWTLWPLFAIYVCASAGALRRYTTYIVIHNWAQVLLFGGQMLVVVLAFAVDPDGPGAALPVPVWMIVLGAETLIVRLALGVTWPQAILIEALSFVTALLLSLAKQFVMVGGG